MIKMRWFYFLIILIKNQRIFLTTRKDLGVGGWGLENPYGVRILNPLEIIGRSLRCHVMSHHDVMTSRLDIMTSAVAMCGMSVLEGLWGMNTDKEGMSREGVSTLRRFHFNFVNISSTNISAIHKSTH